MAEGESVDHRYKSVNSNVIIKEWVTLVRTGSKKHD